ncbi:DUF427 domain-containing protein [Arthrobacter glacialis]|nr:DUF427 domain-containing protein [Arthrobacter glacialis]
MRTEISEKWVRAMVGGTAIVDTRTPMLFWEDSFPVPSYAFAAADVRTDLLIPTEQNPASHNFFHLPKGPVAQWFDLHVDGKVFNNAAWIRDDPAVHDRIVFTWQAGVLDHWLEEDEEVHSHPRDPYKRVEALHSSRHVRVSLDGVTLAETSSPVLLFETYLPIRYYFPKADVDLSKLRSSHNRSQCPYKGFADEYWDAPNTPGVAWSYPHPYPGVQAIEGRVAFYNELVDIAVDGVDLPRPESVFSLKKHRPVND